MPLLVLLACAGPDPDALLRAHDLESAAQAWEARTGRPLDVSHPVVDVLARRAAADPSITAASVADAMDAVHLLEGAPTVGLQPLDLPVARASHLMATTELLALGPLLVVIGRSETGLDRDPYTGGALPWRNGRIVGWGRTGLHALGETVDHTPPPRLLTVRMHDDTGELEVTFTRRDDTWWSTASTDPQSGARLLLASTLYGEQGPDAVVARYPKGLRSR